MKCSGICDTEKFCSEIGRCLSQAIYEGLGETDMQELDELTADEVSLVLPKLEKNIFEKPLSDQVRKIIEYAIK